MVYVRSTRILLCGCESLTSNKGTEGGLDTTEMWYLKISWIEIKSNTEVWEMAYHKRSVIEEVKKRQLDFVGHRHHQE